MNAPIVTVAGNAVADPTLRFTGNGTPVANLRIASTERRQQNGSWVDGSTTYLPVTVWNVMAENVAESVHQGDRLLIHGRLAQNDYEHEGQQRTSYEITADEIAVSLRHATVAGPRTSGQQLEASSPTSDGSEPPR